MRRRDMLTAAALILACVAGTLAYVSSRSRVMHAGFELADLLSRERKVIKKNRALKIALEKRLTPAALEETVKKRMDLMPPDETRVIVIEEKKKN